MQKTSIITRLLACILCVMLTAAAAWTFTGCTERKTPASDTGTGTGTAAEAGTEIGEGQTQFYLTVTDGDGNTARFSVKTDKKTVGEALLELGLIEGDVGPYGLYIKKVNGILADYDTTKTYWAFYVGGEYALTGADTTDIVPGTAYEFRIEK